MLTLAAATVISLLAGCATTPPSNPSPTLDPTNTMDPIEASPDIDNDNSRNTTARNAIETAENAVSGRATDLEWVAEGWKVAVVVGDQQHSLVVSPTGDQVAKQDPTTQPVNADKLSRLTDASVSMRQALDTVVDQAPGDLSKADLEPDAAPAPGMRWDVTIDNGGHAATVTVDAVTGDVRK